MFICSQIVITPLLALRILEKFGFNEYIKLLLFYLTFTRSLSTYNTKISCSRFNNAFISESTTLHIKIISITK